MFLTLHGRCCMATMSRNHRQKLPQHFALSCADGFLKPDLLGTLGDRYQHNVHNANSTHQKRDPSDPNQHCISRLAKLLQSKVVEIQKEPYTVIGIIAKAKKFEPVINTMEEYYTYSENNTGAVYVPPKERSQRSKSALY